MKYTNEYINFFRQSEAGQSFVKWLSDQIESEHRNSEKDPLNAVVPTARASGLRNVIEHIDIMCIKKGDKKE